MGGRAARLSVVLSIGCESGIGGVVAPAMLCPLLSLLLVARPVSPRWLAFGASWRPPRKLDHP
eukprot:13660559-Alexandrium_andersonii.AAC.1